ncbi:unnamed protein product [Camellia sinensis]
MIFIELDQRHSLYLSLSLSLSRLIADFALYIRRTLCCSSSICRWRTLISLFIKLELILDLFFIKSQIIDIILELDRSLLLLSQVLGEKEAIFHAQIRSDQIVEQDRSLSLFISGSHIKERKQDKCRFKRGS